MKKYVSMDAVRLNKFTQLNLFAEYKLNLIKLHQIYANKMNLNDNMIDIYTHEKAIRNVDKKDYYQYLIKYKNDYCGMLEYFIDDSEIDDNKIIYIKCIFIEENYRRKGIAKYIIENLINKYENMRIELESWYEMPANDLYKSLGMKEIKTRYAINI